MRGGLVEGKGTTKCRAITLEHEDGTGYVAIRVGGLNTSKMSISDIPEKGYDLPAMARGSVDARPSMRESSIFAVVSDTVDRLGERTVPESALLRYDPRVLL